MGSEHVAPAQPGQQVGAPRQGVQGVGVQHQRRPRGQAEQSGQNVARSVVPAHAGADDRGPGRSQSGGQQVHVPGRPLRSMIFTHAGQGHGKRLGQFGAHLGHGRDGHGRFHQTGPAAQRA